MSENSSPNKTKLRKEDVPSCISLEEKDLNAFPVIP